MKKMIFATLLLSSVFAVNVAQADQCPPPSALSHKQAGAHWQLDKQYTDAGWYVSSYPYADSSQETHIKPQGYNNITVSVISNEEVNNDTWFVACKYHMTPNSAFPRSLIVTRNELLPLGPRPKLPAVFHDENPDYKLPSKFSCFTSGQDLGYCAW